MCRGIFRVHFLGVRARRWGCVIAWAMVLGTPSLAEGQSNRPNIVVIMSDDAGYDDIGFSNALNGLPLAYVETPNLDALAQQSVVARQGYVAGPLCGPSRAGLLLGQYQQRFGIENNLPNDINSPFGFSADDVLMSDHLRNLGYTTGAIGKWHEGYIDGVNLPLDKGFDEYFGFFSGSRSYYGDTVPSNRMRRGDADVESQWRSEGDPSKYDPVRGRYVTDAFGEEAVDFINRHAHDANPFFLYTAFTAPHTPWSVKQADYDHFSNIADTSNRTVAAMVYAMDRSIGEMLGALEANGIDDNTIVVFLNDNGGPSFPNVPDHNDPLRGFKGYTWEGGIRVPFLIKAPGVTAGVYDAPITAYDLLPTLVAAAGGDASQLDTAGVDLMPYLSGNVVGDPHQLLYWRNRSFWAVRKGDWKLARPNEPQFNLYALYNLATDPGELTNLINQQPDITNELYREFTYWEATLAKPESGNFGSNDRNQFDHFVFRNDQSSVTTWSTTGAWFQAGTANIKTLLGDDAYANGILEFTTRNDSDYTATNNMMRMSGLTFMLNQLRFTGEFTDSTNRAGTIDGNALLLVKSLTGQSPQLQFDSTSSGTPAGFTHRINNELQLLDDLAITGNGTQTFVINGNIRDYYQPRNVTKTGTSQVTLAGNNTFRGNLAVLGGQVKLSGASAAINGANSIVIGSGATLSMDSGLIAVPTIDRSAGGEFQFTGGELRVVDFFGDLTNQGGNYSPGASPALSTLSGNYLQSAAGKLTMEIGGTIPGNEFDRLLVDGSAMLGGILQVNLLNGFLPSFGDSYLLLEAVAGLSGEFANTILPGLTNGLKWRLEYSPLQVRLLVQLQSGGTVPGDYNGDNVVDAADYVVWRNALGSMSMLGADGDGDGIVDQDDYVVWRANFGATAAGGGGTITLPGDYNLNGWVDAADQVLWRNTLGSTTSLAADGNGNGVIDQGDYQVWRANFGASAPPAAGSNLAGVPEPSTVLLGALAAIGLLTCSRHRG